MTERPKFARFSAKMAKTLEMTTLVELSFTYYACKRLEVFTDILILLKKVYLRGGLVAIFGLSAPIG